MDHRRCCMAPRPPAYGPPSALNSPLRNSAPAVRVRVALFLNHRRPAEWHRLDSPAPVPLGTRLVTACSRGSATLRRRRRSYTLGEAAQEECIPRGRGSTSPSTSVIYLGGRQRERIAHLEGGSDPPGQHHSCVKCRSEHADTDSYVYVPQRRYSNENLGCETNCEHPRSVPD